MSGPAPRGTLACLLASVLGAGVGCGGDEVDDCSELAVSSDTACDTTDDCVEEGYSTLSCVNGRCALTCTSDDDCVLATSAECAAAGAPPTAVCEAQLCQLGCPDVACASGETCRAGRCMIAYESFEPSADGDFVSLDTLGWNAISVELANPNLGLAWEGVTGCSTGFDNCAGPAADGEWFALVGTQPTSEKGTATLAPTCRPCACCLECLADPYTDSADILSQCPFSGFVPGILECPASVPAGCATVCSACEACQDAPTGRDASASLVACERLPASKQCPACPSCDSSGCSSCRQERCATECLDLASEACRQCEADQGCSCADCRSCNVCSDAVSCELVDASAAACRRNRLECDALGNDGCYPTPVSYARSELTSLEQALVSPAFDLSASSGTVVLSFSYVPFNVGDTYFQSRQGVPASSWERITQEVRVQLCGADCQLEASWQDASLSGGQVASLPSSGLRANGISLGKQSAVDWRSGRVEVVIPDALRTSELRVRFLPRLATGVRVGIDSVGVRRR